MELINNLIFRNKLSGAKFFWLAGSSVFVLLAVYFAAFWPSVCFAKGDATETIKGRIVFEDGSPAVNVRVGGGFGSLYTVTNTDGSFQLKVRSHNGLFTIQAFKASFAAEIFPIKGGVSEDTYTLRKLSNFAPEKLGAIKIQILPDSLPDNLKEVVFQLEPYADLPLKVGKDSSIEVPLYPGHYMLTLRNAPGIEDFSRNINLQSSEKIEIAPVLNLLSEGAKQALNDFKTRLQKIISRNDESGLEFLIQEFRSRPELKGVNGESVPEDLSHLFKSLVENRKVTLQIERNLMSMEIQVSCNPA